MSTITLWPLWGLGTLALSLGSIVYYWRTAMNFPASIPLIGVRTEVLSKPRAWIRELTAGLATLHEGYFTVGKNPTPVGVDLFESSTADGALMWVSTTQKGNLLLS